MNDEMELAIEDMLEIVSSGANGAELVNINKLMDDAALELRRLRDALANARREERERCIAICDTIENDAWRRYKRGAGLDRGNPHLQGVSDGAAQCAAAIRAISDEAHQPGSPPAVPRAE